MVHADNQGLVLPPNVAALQIVIVPCGITANLSEEGRIKLEESCKQLETALIGESVRVKGDYRDNYSPGWKYNHWELKGVPIRVEIGPKDIEKQQIVAVRRDTGEKVEIKRDNAVQQLKALLDKIQSSLYQKYDVTVSMYDKQFISSDFFRALDDLNTHKVLLKDWSQFTPNLDKKNIILSPFCGEMECEDRIKADSTRDDGENADPGAPSMGAKSLCIPFDQPAEISGKDKCIHPQCKNKPKFYTLFGRSY